MSKQTESKTCQFCHGILFEEDDVVVCPDCGAPYHRDCWRKAGRCVLAEHHGTPLQYDIAEKSRAEQQKLAAEQAAARGEVICPSCGQSTPKNNRFCTRCGTPLPEQERERVRFSAPEINPMAHFTSLGDIDKDEEIEKGVTGQDVGTFLGVRTYRYAKKFKENRRFSWNWVAFLIPAAWYAFHKMYKQMAIALTAFFAGIICFVPFISEINAAISNLPLPQTSEEETQVLKDAVVMVLQNAPITTLLIAFLGLLTISGCMLVSGFFAERAYRSTSIEKILSIKNDSGIEDPAKEMAKAGGTNLFLAVIILLLTTYPDVIINLFISIL